MTKEPNPVLESLAAVTRAARTLEFGPFLQTVVAAASELTGSEAAAILEFDERGKSLRFLAVPPAYQDVRSGLPIPIGTSASGWAVQASEPLRIPNNGMDPSFLSG